jgi:hypothetical protein
LCKISRQEEKSKLRFTPKKSVDKDSMKTTPTMGRGASPAIGPSGTLAIRKLCFGLVGEASISLPNVKANVLQLSKVKVAPC